MNARDLHPAARGHGPERRTKGHGARRNVPLDGRPEPATASFSRASAAPYAVSDIAARLGLGQSLVSHHLRLLARGAYRAAGTPWKADLLLRGR